MGRLLLGVAAIVICGLAGGLSPACFAASFARKDLAALAAEADTIVVGWVRGQQSRRLSSGLIVTEFVIAVAERIKGDSTEPTETVTMAGGTIGDESQQIVGFPSLIAGARYVLFIGRERVALVPFVGGHQGMNRIHRDPSTNEDYVVDRVESAEPAHDRVDAAHGPDSEEAPAAGARLGLNHFKARIRRALHP